MNSRPDSDRRRIPVLAFLLLFISTVWPFEATRGQSIIADQDVIGNGISLQELKNSHCDHLESQHAGTVSSVVCSLPPEAQLRLAASTGLYALGNSIVTEGDIVGDGISLKALKDSHCGSLARQHAGSTLPAVCALAPGTRFVFVTSTGSPTGGNFVAWANQLINPLIPFADGLVAADAICQFHADNAQNPLPGVYKAWLSTDSVDAKDRIGDHRWVLADTRTPVAGDLANLLYCDYGCLQNPINRDENYQPYSGGVFTGTSGGGNGTGQNCNNWTSNDPLPTAFTFGRSDGVNSHRNISAWTYNLYLTPGRLGCDFSNVQYPLYCFGN